LARAYYQRRLGGGLSKVDAIKRVARRMSGMIYAMLRSGEAYDRKRLEQAVANRQAVAWKDDGTSSKDRQANQIAHKPYRPSRTPAYPKSAST
jgi:hypothetical protein